MKLVGGKAPSVYVGWHAACQYCGQHVVFEDGDLGLAERGDFKDESTYRWECPSCNGRTTKGLSRMKEEDRAIVRRLAITAGKV